MEKQYTSSIIKCHKITKREFFDGVPFKGYVANPEPVHTCCLILSYPHCCFCY